MQPDEFQAELDKNAAEKKSQGDDQAKIKAINKAGIKNVEATNANAKSTARALKDVRGRVTVENPDLAKTQDVTEAIDAINKLNITTFMSSPSYHDMATTMRDLVGTVETLQEKLKDEGLTTISKTLDSLVTKMENIAKQQASTKIAVDGSFSKVLTDLQKTISSIDFKPEINVQTTTPKVVQTPINLQPIVDGLSAVEKAIKETQANDENEPENSLDLQPVIDGLQAVQESIHGLTFPVPNYILPFKDVNGRATQVQLDASGNVPTSGSGGGGGGAVTIADGADVTLGAKADGKSTATDTTPVTVMQVLKEISFMEQNPASRAVTNAGTFAVQATLSAETTKVIGVVRTADGSGNLLTSTANALDVNIKSPATLPVNMTQLNGSATATVATGVQAVGISDGTNIGSVVSGDTGFNGQAVANATKTYTFTTSATGAQTLLANTPTEGFATVEVVYTSVGSGLGITGGQFSTASGGTYVTSSNFASGTSGFSGALGTTVNTIYSSPIKGNFFQIAVSALTSGTFTGTVTLRSNPPQASGVQASQTGTWTVGANSATGSAVPANAFYQALNARTTSPAAASTGNLVGFTADVMGEALVATGGLVTTAVAVSASNTVVKGTPGRLCNILVTTTGVTALQVFDNATTNSGTIIGQLPASAAVGSIYSFNMPAAAGITVAGSATNPAVTISWI